LDPPSDCLFFILIENLSFILLYKTTTSNTQLKLLHSKEEIAIKSLILMKFENVASFIQSAQRHDLKNMHAVHMNA